MDTVIKDNVNPIEKVERSNLILASTIHDKPSNEILKASETERILKYSPSLFFEQGDTVKN
jgi:hypothetical protein